MENKVVASKLDCNHDDQPIEEEECPGRTTEEVCSVALYRADTNSLMSRANVQIFICLQFWLIVILSAGRVGIRHTCH